MENQQVQQIVIQPADFAPFVTPERYAELTGLTIPAVKTMIVRGKLPTLHRDAPRKVGGARTFINMIALRELAKEQAELYKEWQASI